MRTRKIRGITYTKSIKHAFNNNTKENARFHAKKGWDLGYNIRVIKNSKGTHDLWIDES